MWKPSSLLEVLLFSKIFGLLTFIAKIPELLLLHRDRAACRVLHADLIYFNTWHSLTSLHHVCDVPFCLFVIVFLHMGAVCIVNFLLLFFFSYAEFLLLFTMLKTETYYCLSGLKCLVFWTSYPTTCQSCSLIEFTCWKCVPALNHQIYWMVSNMVLNFSHGYKSRAS